MPNTKKTGINKPIIRGNDSLFTLLSPYVDDIGRIIYLIK